MVGGTGVNVQVGTSVGKAVSLGKGISVAAGRGVALLQPEINTHNKQAMPQANFFKKSMRNSSFLCHVDPTTADQFSRKE
jgi:hypothetical protein